MKATAITDAEIADKLVSSLPTRPTAPAAFGGRGYSAKEMKEAFDALPLFIRDRLNLLLENIESEGTDSIAHSIPTGIRTGHTLADLFEEIRSGAILSTITVNGESFYSLMSRIKAHLDGEGV